MEQQVFCMETRPLRAGYSGQIRSTILPVVLLAAALVTGCAQVDHLKARFRESQSTPRAVTTEPAVRGRSATPQLGVIVNDELQRGHYVEGEKALRRYLAEHPGDVLAQSMLRQLTGDPGQMLGRTSRSYVVHPGDTFSTLAARYLGDPDLFLALARYNGSTNPSRLSTGESIRLPMSAPSAPVARNVTASGSSATPQRLSPGDASTAFSTPASTIEAAAAKAARLQAESVALLDQGQKSQALARLGEALDMDPSLRPSGPKAVSLRHELVANYHQRAIVLYRDQHLNQAITLWNRVLAIDPGYEPAVIYRARALELKQRLKQL